MGKKLSFVLVMVFVGLCASCQWNRNMLDNANSPTDTHSLNTPTAVLEVTRDELTARWLAGQPCSPPCWENILVGQSFIDDAKTILQANSLIALVEVTNSNYDRYNDDVIVSYHSSSSEEENSSLLNLDKSGRVISVDLDLSPTSLKIFRQTYGDPSHVMTLSYSGPDDGFETYWGLEIIWFSQGIRLATYGQSPFPMIDDNLLFTEAWVFSPNWDDYVLTTNFDALTRVKPWHGNDKFETYLGEPGINQDK